MRGIHVIVSNNLLVNTLAIHSQGTWFNFPFHHVQNFLKKLCTYYYSPTRQHSCCTIAKKLGTTPSIVSRIIKRYRAIVALQQLRHLLCQINNENCKTQLGNPQNNTLKLGKLKNNLDSHPSHFYNSWVVFLISSVTALINSHTSFKQLCMP